MTLTGLAGVTGQKEFDWIESVTGAIRSVKAGKPASTAKDNGSVTIWPDDYGHIRGEAQRHRRTLDARIFKNEKEIRTWLKEWLEKIR